MNPERSDGQVRIRPFQPADAAALHAAAKESAAAVLRWLPFFEESTSEAAAAAWIAAKAERWADGTDYRFAIVEEATGRLLGSGGLNHLNRVHHFANLMYWIRTSASRKGFTTAATRLLARFGFEALGLVRVEIVVEPENLASRRVAEKAGAVEEGRLRHRLYRELAPRDGVMYSLLPADLFPASRTDNPDPA